MLLTLTETYCTLKNQNCCDSERLKRHARYIGCNNELPADHNVKMKQPFERHLDQSLQAKQSQVDLLIKGDIARMKVEQQNVINSPTETCQFLKSYWIPGQMRQMYHGQMSLHIHYGHMRLHMEVHMHILMKLRVTCGQEL